ncbi:MAG: phage major capsid protein [Chloroflexi bacterium]|nr:phage major capsid protein [Chloroflexota bacterium]
MEEINSLGEDIDAIVEAETAAKGFASTDADDSKNRGEMRHAGEGHDGSPNVKVVDLGKLFIESKAFKDYNNGSGIGPQAALKEIEVKTLFQTSAGWAPETTRTGRLVLDEQRPIAIVNVLPQTTTTQNAIVYMEETTFTNAAAEAAEAGTYAESALALTEQTSNVRKIATFLPVTDEQLADEPRARDYVNNRLMFMLRQRLDIQIIAGDGSAPNLRGILNVSGIGSQAKAGDPTPDAIYKGMDLCRVNGFAEPDTALFHPTDWQAIRLLRTADGIYIWGAPSEPGPVRIWGLPVVLSTAVTLNTAIVGAFREFSELASRQGIDVQVSNSHSTFFIEGKLAIRADIRVALIFYRASAFSEITGI